MLTDKCDYVVHAPVFVSDGAPLFEVHPESAFVER